MKFYSRFNKEHIDGMIHHIRRNPLDKTHIMVKLDPDLYFESTIPRCYVNTQIFTLLDHYRIPHDVRKEFIFSGKIFKKDVAVYMNRIMKILLGINFPISDIMLSHILADIKSSFSMISFICNDVVTMDHSIYDYVEEFLNNPEFRKLFEEPIFLPTDDPWTIRNKVNSVIDKFKDGTINLQPLSDFLRYGTKVKAEQLLMFFSYDLAPDPLKSNQCLAPLGVSIIDGISTVWVMIVLDNISRMNIVSSKTEIKVTGVQSKRLSTALQDSKLNAADTRDMLDDCGSTDYMEVKMESKKDLSFFKYKYFYDIETNKRLGTIDEDRVDLIGQTIYIRTFILCRGDVICKECYGYNWKMVSDTPLYKGNLSLYILQEFNKKMQLVISVKHHCGWVYTDMVVIYGGQKTTMEWILKNTDIFELVGWNKVRVNPKYSYTFVPHSVSEDKKGKKIFTKEKLFVDGKEFETTQALTEISPRLISYTVPNNSVLMQAEALKVAVSKHSSKDKETGKADFDHAELKGKSLSEQAKLMYLYQKSKVKMDHFIYYEAIIHALIRDADNPTKRVSEDTKDIMMISADSVLTKADRSTNISTTLPHGYINNIFNTIHQNCVPSEYDILYNNLTDRKILKKNIFAEFNAILNSANITNNDNVSINAKDDGLTLSDMMFTRDGE